jgi:hypothetical protein
MQGASEEVGMRPYPTKVKSCILTTYRRIPSDDDLRSDIKNYVLTVGSFGASYKGKKVINFGKKTFAQLVHLLDLPDSFATPRSRKRIYEEDPEETMP